MHPLDLPHSTMPLPRDGNVAVQEEFDAARKRRTVEAYDLFIARYPGHPLEAVARSEREELLGLNPKGR
jgi:hypothetical protein